MSNSLDEQAVPSNPSEVPSSVGLLISDGDGDELGRLKEEVIRLNDSVARLTQERDSLSQTSSRYIHAIAVLGELLDLAPDDQSVPSVTAAVRALKASYQVTGALHPLLSEVRQWAGQVADEALYSNDPDKDNLTAASESFGKCTPDLFVRIDAALLAVAGDPGVGREAFLQSQLNEVTDLVRRYLRNMNRETHCGEDLEQQDATDAYILRRMGAFLKNKDDSNGQ